MTEAVGPVFTGGFEEFVITDEKGEGHTLLFLPDRNNDALQREGKAPLFYYIPEKVRLARNPNTNDFKFRHIHFVGVFDETTAGISRGETSGGVLALTTTSRFPASVLKQAEAQILDRFSGRNDKYWGLRTRIAPQIRIAPINANQTAISSLAPDSSGATPGIDMGGAMQPGLPEGPRSRDAVVYGHRSPWTPVVHGRGFRGAEIDAWAWRLQGSGPGSITGGENAYGGLIGPIPSEIVWTGFHGTYSPLFVTQNLVMPMWSQQMRVKITGKWERIFTHFSGHANARYLWFSADIKAEFNRLRINGDIKVEADIDGTMPGAGEMEKLINQRIDLIVQLFTEQAKKVIFDPPVPQVEPAQAPSGGIFSSIFGVGGAGLALKFRRDEQYVDLAYEETRYFRYNQPHTISSSLEGFYNEIKNDPAAESKYFQRLVLGELNRKIFRIVKPVVNWPDKARNWAGEPVAFLSTQIGYPTKEGAVGWKPTTFQKLDSPETTFRPTWIQWRKGEVANAPRDWEPDMTYVKRKIHLLEAPTESEFPFFRIDVEQNVIDLDPGQNGTLTNDNILEVRADAAGTLDVGPVALGVELQSSAEIVEVEFRAKGTRADGTDRKTKVTRFRWMMADQNEPRFWRIYTGQSDFKTEYEYRVNVTVRGTLSQRGQAWSGPWEPAIGNGPVMVNVPLPDDPGVTKRQLTMRELFSTMPVRAAESAEPEVGAPSPVEAPAAGPPPPVGGNGGAPVPPTTVPQPVAVPEPVASSPPAPPVIPPQPPAYSAPEKREVAGYGVASASSAEGWMDMTSNPTTAVVPPSTATKRRESSSIPTPVTAEGWIEQPYRSNE